MNMETGYELNVPVGDGNKDVKAIISNNEVIWERAIPTPKSGVAPLSFRATRAKPLLDWEITGKTYQAWTPSPEPQIGNNKLDNSKIEKSATVTNFAYTDSSVSFGSMTVGSTINSAEIKAEDTSYAFSFTGDTNKVTFALRCYDSSHTYIGDANKIFDEESRAVMTTLANTVYVRLYVTTTVQGNISLTNLMLNKGNTVMTFEPFGYLPNTGACPVQGVGDKTENLLDESTMVVGFYANSDFVISSGSTNAYRSFRMYLKAGTYTLSGENIRTARSIVNGVYDKTIVYNSLTFTVNEYSEVGFSFRDLHNDIEEWDNRPIMLNSGSEPLPYKPYGYEIPVVSGGLTTPIYLNSPLMTDEILKSDGTREVEWRKVYLKELQWGMYGTYGNQFLFYSDSLNGKIRCADSSITHGLCSDYTAYPNSMIDSLPNYGFRVRNSDGRLYLNNVDYNNLSDFINSLNDCYLYYILLTPSSETISAPQIPTAKGTNTLSIDTEVQPSNLDITYLSSGFEPQPLKTADGQMLYTNNNQPLNTLE